MTPKQIYEQILREIPAGAERQVYEVLTGHIGERNAIRIEELAYQVFQSRGDTAVRKTRDVIEIETLRTNYRVPVMSNSGKAGRWLAASEEELQSTIADLEARKGHIEDVIRSLRQARIPAQQPVFSKPEQPRLV